MALSMGKVKNTNIPQPTDAASRRRDEELETICRTSPIGLGLVDRDLRYLRVNNRNEQVITRVNPHLELGGSFEEETGKSVIEESAGE